MKKAENKLYGGRRKIIVKSQHDVGGCNAENDRGGDNDHFGGSRIVDKNMRRFLGALCTQTTAFFYELLNFKVKKQIYNLKIGRRIKSRGYFSPCFLYFGKIQFYFPILIH